MTSIDAKSSRQLRRLAWVLNLDAELELLEPSGYTPSARVLSQLEQYGAGSRSLLASDDVLVVEGTDASGLIGRAWCPTPSAVARLVAAGADPEPYPDVSVLRRVNHRRFAFELGGGLPEQRYIERRADLEALVARIDFPWLLKRPLAFAGRGQLRIYRAPDPKQWSWIDASLRPRANSEVDGLVVEPLVTPVLELSLHGFIQRDGRYELGRICVQTVTERGVFRGIRLCEPDEITSVERRAVFEQGDRVADALHGAGYFGPFGIDAYRYAWSGGRGFCELGEINARYTMGFSTGLARSILPSP